MEILNILQGLKNFEKAQETRSQSESKRGSEKSKTSTSDTVKFSSAARIFSKTLLEAREAPEARQQRINKLKELVERGEYTPDSKKIAENLVKYDLHLII